MDDERNTTQAERIAHEIAMGDPSWCRRNPPVGLTPYQIKLFYGLAPTPLPLTRPWWRRLFG